MLLFISVQYGAGSVLLNDTQSLNTSLLTFMGLRWVMIAD